MNKITSIALVIAALVLASALSAFLVYTALAKKLSASAVPSAGVQIQAQAAPEPSAAPAKTARPVDDSNWFSFPIGDFTTNIIGSQNYIKVSVTAKVAIPNEGKKKKAEKEGEGGDANAAAMEKYAPLLKDTALTVLAGLKPEDLNSGLMPLIRQRMKKDMNKALGSNRILDIFITDLAYQ